MNNEINLRAHVHLNLDVNILHYKRVGHFAKTKFLAVIKQEFK